MVEGDGGLGRIDEHLVGRGLDGRHSGCLTQIHRVLGVVHDGGQIYEVGRGSVAVVATGGGGDDGSPKRMTDGHHGFPVLAQAVDGFNGGGQIVSLVS